MVLSSHSTKFSEIKLEFYWKEGRCSVLQNMYIIIQEKQISIFYRFHSFCRLL